MNGIDRLVCHETPGATLLASLSGGRLVEVSVAVKDRVDLTGALVLGRIERFAPELDAAFVDVGAERAGFLRRIDMVGFEVDRPSAGLPVLVQVTRDALDDKGARLTMNLGLVGRYLVFHPHGEGAQLSRRVMNESARQRLLAAVDQVGSDEGGWVVRTAASGASSAAIVSEGEALLVRWDSLRTRALASRPPTILAADPHPLLRAVRDRGGLLAEIAVDDRALAQQARRTLDAFGDRAELRVVIGDGDVLDTHDVASQIETALQPHVVLPSGVEILFEPGRTLCAIDIDSGTAGARQGQGPRTPLDVNLDAAEEIARQIRLRNIGGVIVVDFIDMRAPGDRARVLGLLAERVLDDPVPTQVVGATRLGLVEMTRARRGPTLTQAIDAFEHANETDQSAAGDRDGRLA